MSIAASTCSTVDLVIVGLMPLEKFGGTFSRKRLRRPCLAPHRGEVYSEKSVPQERELTRDRGQTGSQGEWVWPPAQLPRLGTFISSASRPAGIMLKISTLVPSSTNSWLSDRQARQCIFSPRRPHSGQ